MKRMAYLAFTLLGVIWGSNFLFMKAAAGYISPTQIVFLRTLSGFVPIALFALSRRALHWRDLRHLHHFVVMALLATVLYYYAYAQGARLLLSSVAGMLSGAIPLFSFIAAALFLRNERVTLRMLSGVILGLCGVVVIAQPWHHGGASVDLRGVAYMAGGSLCVGGSFVYAKRFLSPLGLSPLALCTYQIGSALMILSLITRFDGIAHIASAPLAFTGLVLGLGLAGTGLAYILYYFIVAQLGAVAAAGVSYIPPLVALLIGTLFAHEPFQWIDLLAMALILSGVYRLQTGQRALATPCGAASTTPPRKAMREAVLKQP